MTLANPGRTPLREIVAFYDAKGTVDDYAPSVALGHLRAILAERDALYTALADELAARPVVNPGNPDPPAAEDYFPAPGLAGFPLPPDRIAFAIEPGPWRLFRGLDPVTHEPIPFGPADLLPPYDPIDGYHSWAWTRLALECAILLVLAVFWAVT